MDFGTDIIKVDFICTFNKIFKISIYLSVN